MPHVVIKLKKTPFVNHIFTSFLAGSKLLLYIAPGFCYISLILFLKKEIIRLIRILNKKKAEIFKQTLNHDE